MNLREAREEKRLTITELARRVNISPASIRMYERGAYRPPADIAAALSEILGIEVPAAEARPLTTRPRAEYTLTVSRGITAYPEEWAVIAAAVRKLKQRDPHLKLAQFVREAALERARRVLDEEERVS